MMQAKDLRGSYTALITPFKDGVFDEAAFTSFVNWQVEQGVHGLVPAGTTGESPTLTHEEHMRVVEVCVQAAQGRVPVMAGTGSNATSEAVEFTEHAAKIGADMALVVVPYYNKPNDAGLYAHFKAVHDAAEIPIVIYNIPGRSVINMSDELIAKVAELPRVIGLKDATGDLSRVSTLRHRVGNNLALLSGEDMTAVGFNAMGGQGCISVTANIVPTLCADVQNACLAGDYDKALSMHDMLVPLHDVMFSDTSPIPVKAAAKLIGQCESEVRLPLVEARDETRKDLQKMLQGLGAL